MQHARWQRKAHITICMGAEEVVRTWTNNTCHRTNCGEKNIKEKEIKFRQIK